MKYQLVIFDMDGTLVQSEDCASQALIDVIPALTLSVSEVTHKYRGMRLAQIFDDIQSSTSTPIPADTLERYRVREEALSRSMITPSAGANEMLEQLRGNRCIASNAPVEKTERSLEICGLRHHFPSGIYSAYQVQAWKPDPALFAYAANAYGVAPADCLVVEDSEVGIRAAQAAGMSSIFYNPHGISPTPAGVSVIIELSELLTLQH